LLRRAWVVLGLVWAACAADPDTASGTSELSPEAQADASQAVFDAFLYCEGLLVGTRLTPSLISGWGDVSLQQFAEARPSLSRIMEGPHAGAPPTRLRDPQVNPCFTAVSRELGARDIDSHAEDGFCRAELNYCVARELSLRAESFVETAPSPELEAVLLRASRERFQASALENLSSLAFYEARCSVPDRGAWAAECVRLEHASRTFAGQVSSRILDAALQTERLVSREVDARMRMSASFAPVLDPAAEVERLWGAEGVRTRALESLFGKLDYAEISAQLNTRRAVDIALPSSPVDDERARLAVDLLGQFQIPIGLYSSTESDSYALALWGTNDVAVRATYNLLDHRLAAHLRLPPYETVDAPDARALQTRAAFATGSDFVAFADRPLPGGRSPLRTEYQLTPEDIGHALSLAADLIELQDASFVRTPQVPLNASTSIDAVQLGATRDRTMLLVAAALQEDPTARTWDAVDSEMGFLPRAGGGLTVDNGYAFSLPRVDATQTFTIAQDQWPTLGAVPVLHLVRAHAARVLSGTTRFVDREMFSRAIAMIDAAIGPTWTEIDRSFDEACDCSAPSGTGVSLMTTIPLSPISPPPAIPSTTPSLPSLGGSTSSMLPTPISPISPISPIPINPIPTPIPLCTPPVSRPLYATCTNCGACRVVRPETETALHWQIAFEPGDARYVEGEPVFVRSYDDARCLVEGRHPGSTRTCSVSATPLDEIEARGHWQVGRTVRRFRLPGLDSFSAQGPGARAYVLWRTPDGSHALVDVVRPRQRAAWHGFGGTLSTTASEVWARRSGRVRQVAALAAGIRNGVVPPLESELTSDSDTYEDSYQRYLDEARDAATNAATLLSAARDAQLAARLDDLRDTVSLERAALAETERVADLCGASGECAVERMSTDVTLGDLGLVTVFPAPVALEVPCEDVIANPYDEFDPEYDDSSARERIQNARSYFRIALECAAHVYSDRMARLSIRGLPRIAVDEVLAGGRGDMGAYDGQVREELIRVFQRLADVQTTFRRFSSQVEVVRAANDALVEQLDGLTTTQAERRVCQARRGLAVIQSVASIVASIGSMESGNSMGNLEDAGRAGGDLARLGNTAADTALRSCDDDASASSAAADGIQRLATSLDGFRGLAFGAFESVSDIYGAIASIDHLGERADLAREIRSASEAMAERDAMADLPEWRALQSFQAGRADAALRRAITAAYVARRAVELRFATDLSALTADEPFVEAPATWVDRLTDVPRDAVPVERVDEDGETVTISTSAEAILDYVDRLERFVEGYPFARRFRDGEDLQVLDLATFLGLAEGEPIHDALTYACNDGTEVLGLSAGSAGSAGDFSGAGISDSPTVDPCVGHDGVRHAELVFAVPAVFEDYLERRLVAGAFNHRTVATAVNLDGVGVIDCLAARSPSECYRDANVPYDLRQSGDVILQSFEAGLQTFDMEPGLIQRARALVAERQLSNPLSSVDRSLIEPYLRGELRGRPLAGTYVLRIHGRPEIRWENLETIQLLLSYRYWTRQR